VKKMTDCLVGLDVRQHGVPFPLARN
jgi:hypothetical protein